MSIKNEIDNLILEGKVFPGLNQVICPHCGGAKKVGKDECPVCQGYGAIIPPGEIRKKLEAMRSELIGTRRTLRQMFEGYIRFHNHIQPGSPTEKRLMRVYESKTRRDLDLKMTKDMVSGDQIAHNLSQLIEVGEEFHARTRDLFSALKEVSRMVAAPPPPPPPAEVKRTKRAGKVCSFPRCTKDSKVWDEKNRGWCRPHAYQRGLLGGPRTKEDS